MPETRLDGISILVVEDEPLIACEIALCIEEAGGTVIGPIATLGRALAVIEQTTPSAAVLDVRLGRDEVGPAARALASRRIPFLFHTGHADGVTLADWREAPIVRKPAPPQELLQTLRELIAELPTLGRKAE